MQNKKLGEILNKAGQVFKNAAGKVFVEVLNKTKFVKGYQLSLKSKIRSLDKYKINFFKLIKKLNVLNTKFVRIFSLI